MSDPASLTTRTALGEIALIIHTSTDPLIQHDLNTGHAYAWGRLDQGHPAVCSFTPSERASSVDTAWGFATLWARMQAQYRDQDHPRNIAFGQETAWERFASTGWIDENLEEE